ncbi:DsrE family protein [Martelella soudanensis]
MKTLFILNDPPYGTERCYNGLRLAHPLLKKDPDAEITVFLMADAVIAARKGQKTLEGYCNMKRMLKRVLAKGAVLLCGTCMDTRGMTDDDVLDGARRSTMDELGEATRLKAIRYRFPRLHHVFADGGYAGQKLLAALEGNGAWTIEIIKRSDTARGFEVLPRRWVVERTFAWLGRCRRLAKDWEKSIQSSSAWAYIASIRIIIRRLATYCYVS